MKPRFVALRRDSRAIHHPGSVMVSLIPFGACLIGSYPLSRTALFLYGVLLSLLTAYRWLMGVYFTRPELITEPLPRDADSHPPKSSRRDWSKP